MPDEVPTTLLKRVFQPELLRRVPLAARIGYQVLVGAIENLVRAAEKPKEAAS